MTARPPPPAGLDAGSRACLHDSVAGAAREGQTRWFAHVVEADLLDPLTCYASAGTRSRALWTSGETGDWSVCFGVQGEIESAGPDRFGDVRDWAAQTGARLDWTGAPRSTALPTFFGGFGFEPESRGGADWKAFPAAHFVLPEIILEHHEGRTRGVVIARIEPGTSVESAVSVLDAGLDEIWRIAGGKDTHASEQRPKADPVDLRETPMAWPAGPEYRVRADRSHDVFRAQVGRAFEAFAAGTLEKVVLARSLSIDHDEPIDVVAFLARLRGLYPTCTLLAIGRGEDTFLAATPETLVRVRGAQVETAALAGSAPRGRTPEEDESLASVLVSSPKEQAEHAHVVDAIRGVLEARCDSLEIPAAPALRKLFGIQHLETPIRGRLRGVEEGREPLDALALVEALHPTPAVGGVPKTEALAWLTRTEGLDRGWYAAPIGWLDGEGGGDFRVALRSALIRNRLEGDGFAASRTLLFAGAGIVAGSEPEQELVETRIKLRALLAPLTEI